MTDVRLIERWMPISALGEESVRERRFSIAGKVLPPHNSLHVWWARRPLIASRAAILASCLPADFDHSTFLQMIGIKGDPVAARRRNDRAIRAGKIPLGDKEYGYPRAFKHQPDPDALKRAGLSKLKLLDPTAGGGAIPFESMRLGLHTVANDLNPVAALIERATIEFPIKFGPEVLHAYRDVAENFIRTSEKEFSHVFPKEPGGAQVLAYIWARTVTCPYCDGLVPLSPNWRLSPKGVGIRIQPILEGERWRCAFEIVDSVSEHSKGTVADGDGICPFVDCGRVIPSDEIKSQAKLGNLGDQLIAIAVKRRVQTKAKNGKVGRDKWERGYRAPTSEDNNSDQIANALKHKLSEWAQTNVIPDERFPEQSNDNRPIQYGMPFWRDFYSPRQLLGHGIASEVFRNMVEEDERSGKLSDVRRAAYVYLSFALDKFRDYNSRMTRWHSKREVMVNTFDRHDFAFKWSYAEMAPANVGMGFSWVLEQVDSALEGLIGLVQSGPIERDLLSQAAINSLPSEVVISSKSGDALDHLSSASMDVVVMDPPYYNNVMYAELSDFFYVWLKRTAGLVVPELFTRALTDKDNEAVASPAKFASEDNAQALAGRDYQERMQRIFEECRRVLKPNGIMTLMFTHKATGAWDALTKGLMEAGFTVSASWPVNTEPESSLHIKDRAAANSTIFLGSGLITSS